MNAKPKKPQNWPKQRLKRKQRPQKLQKPKHLKKALPNNI